MCLERRAAGASLRPRQLAGAAPHGLFPRCRVAGSGRKGAALSRLLPAPRENPSPLCGAAGDVAVSLLSGSAQSIVIATGEKSRAGSGRTPDAAHRSRGAVMLRKPLILLLICLLALPVASAAAEPALEPLPIDLSPGMRPDKDAYLPDQGGYEDASIAVRIYKDRAYDSAILYAHPDQDPSQLRTAPAAPAAQQPAARPSPSATRPWWLSTAIFPVQCRALHRPPGQRLRNRPTGGPALHRQPGRLHVAYNAGKGHRRRQ